MSSESKEASGCTPTSQQLTYLWTEYKYRHELCWKAVYKVVAAVIALAVIPYAYTLLTKDLRGWMLVPPAIGTVLAVFGIFVVNNELRLFAKVKIAHHNLQDQFLSSVFSEGDVKDATLHHIKPCMARWTLFDVYVHLLMVVIVLLSLGNTLFLALVFIPHLS